MRTETRAVPLGQVVATPGALDALAEAKESPLPYLMRHTHGDWGEVCPEDARANDAACETEERLLSSYRLRDGTKLWIITEADRSSTCILLPEEY
jgi:invasion protein IalB